MRIDTRTSFVALWKVFYLTTLHLIEFSHRENLEIIHSVVKSLNIHLARKQFVLFVLGVLYRLKMRVSDELVMEVLDWLIINPDTFFDIDPTILLEAMEKPALSALENHPKKAEVL